MEGVLRRKGAGNEENKGEGREGKKACKRKME
jgi:hypothetical protein